jgi:hypothetical protein
MRERMHPLSPFSKNERFLRWRMKKDFVGLRHTTQTPFLSSENLLGAAKKEGVYPDLSFKNQGSSYNL